MAHALISKMCVLAAPWSSGLVHRDYTLDKSAYGITSRISLMSLELSQQEMHRKADTIRSISMPHLVVMGSPYDDSNFFLQSRSQNPDHWYQPFRMGNTPGAPQ
ncbi:transcription factor GATA-5 [Platysternon megacephalum]|uniref:Transcription factor GATA-5 n=1 Tax=Platysternon megacephalum TaxID=55544 RepID=A0A4D9E762_9SAUR|nr:transcription factor GATA-5 [Platysternon megacephalum]